MEKTKKKLQTSLLIAVEIFTIMLSVCLGIIGYKTYYNGMSQKYMDYEEAVLNLAANGIDWDAVEISIVAGRQDAAHKALSDHLDFIKSNTEIDWLYMIEPLNDNDKDNMKYICTGNTEADYAKGMTNRLGDLSGTEFPAEVAREYLNFYKNSKPGEYWYYPNKTEWGSVFTTSIVIRNSIGNPLGVLSVDINMSDIDATIRIYPLNILIAGFICAAIFIIVLILWLNRRLIHPLKSLQNSAVDFVSKASGDDVQSLNFEDPNIKTQDEIQSLSNALVTMASDTKEYMQKLLVETKENERISADLNVATQIQAAMLPRVEPEFSGRAEFELAASMDPAKEVGGDFYDFFFVDEDRIMLVIGDVSGKGVPAALFMAISKTIIRNRALTSDSLSELIEQTNKTLCENNEESMFVTIGRALINLKTGKVKTVNAGHEDPAIRRAGGSYELDVYPHDVVLGLIPDAGPFVERVFMLEPGDSIFVYTDGVPEAVNPKEEFLGCDRMIKALNTDPDRNVEDTIEGMTQSIADFASGADRFDDVTMLCFKYFGADR